jgi:hypothetical protein
MQGVIDGLNRIIDMTVPAYNMQGGTLVEREIAHVAVPSRHRGRVDRDQDFVVLGNRFIHLPDSKEIGGAVLRVYDGFHGR